MLREIDYLRIRIKDEIKRAPIKKGKMYIAVDEHTYALLQMMEEWDMIEFTFHETVPHEPIPFENNSLRFRDKLYILSIAYEIENGFIHIKRKNGNDIVWRW